MPLNPLIADDLQGSLEVLLTFRRNHLRQMIGAMLVELNYWPSLAEAARRIGVSKPTMTRARRRLLAGVRVTRFTKEKANEHGANATTGHSVSVTGGSRQDVSKGVKHSQRKGIL